MHKVHITFIQIQDFALTVVPTTRGGTVSCGDDNDELSLS